MTVGGRLDRGRIIAAQAGALFLVFRSSLALIVEELAITTGAGGHGMPPSPGWLSFTRLEKPIIIPDISSRGLSYRKAYVGSSLAPGETQV